MVQNSIALTGLLIISLFQSLPPYAPVRVSADLPDLIIKQYEFVSNNDKRVRVLVANEGKAESASCRLELAIRKIQGTASTRSASETVPALKPGREEWVTLSATALLPAAISLKDTTFRLTVDETRIVTESREDNNETWHNSD